MDWCAQPFGAALGKQRCFLSLKCVRFLSSVWQVIIFSSEDRSGEDRLEASNFKWFIKDDSWICQCNDPSLHLTIIIALNSTMSEWSMVNSYERHLSLTMACIAPYVKFLTVTNDDGINQHLTKVKPIRHSSIVLPFFREFIETYISRCQIPSLICYKTALPSHQWKITSCTVNVWLDHFK